MPLGVKRKLCVCLENSDNDHSVIYAKFYATLNVLEQVLHSGGLMSPERNTVGPQKLTTFHSSIAM
ncbi:hypothetical protein CH337_18635 [Rhodoblastus acidophilus]|nr:hypothetical protein CKO16_20745 [Rhodoblastus acidophilus]RAI16960.1 hypothetical protein CH337_18635 [Rhodoblastus acidophilus]